MSSHPPFLDVERWQPVQDALTEVLGVNLGLMDVEGRPLTRSINVLKSPWNILTSSSKGFSRYAECIETLLTEARSRPRPLVTVQVSGLHLCAVPIEQANQIAAYFILGPCLVGRRGEPDDYISLAKEFDIRIDRWMEALQEIKILSFAGLNAVASLLRQLGEIARPSPQAKRLLVFERLLDTAIQTVDAETGSILVPEEASKELVIGLARGLKEEVVRGTRVRIGEGIAGVVAKEQTALRINPETAPARLKKALRRPEVQDALVIPLVQETRLLGVLCVSTLRSGRRFPEEGVEILRNLTWFAEQALS